MADLLQEIYLRLRHVENKVDRLQEALDKLLEADEAADVPQQAPEVFT